jgi:hypothetical protein
LNTGYGSVTLDSLVVTSNVATATKSTGHGFTAAGAVNPVIRIAGATPSGLNADYRVSISSANVFTFATSGISDQTATGTITAKRAPLDFTLPFTPTSTKAVYQSSNVQGSQRLIRVDDSPNYSANVDMYEGMTNIDTGSNRFNNASFGWSRSYTTDGTARPWILVGDGRLFFMCVDFNSTGVYFALQAFGDTQSFLVGDAYKSMLAGGVNGAGGTRPVAGVAVTGLTHMDGSTNPGLIRLDRNYQGTSGGVNVLLSGHRIVPLYSGISSIAIPDPISGADIVLSSVTIQESNALLRGRMPGMYCILNNLYDTSRQGTIIDSIAGLSGHSGIILMALYPAANNHSGVLIDITGPWTY